MGFRNIKELSGSAACIIVLTRDNLNSSWIMFEAGAISCTLDRAKVCPLIFDIEETDLQGPLAQFQATRFIKQDVRTLFFNINAAAGDNRLSETVAGTVFEKWWPDLEAQLIKVLEGHKAAKSVSKDIRSERELIEELLLLTRKFSTEFSSPKVPSQKVAAAIVHYEATMYKPLVVALKKFFDLGSFDNNELELLRNELQLVISTVKSRSTFAWRKGLIEDLNNLLSEVQAYLDLPDDPAEKPN